MPLIRSFSDRPASGEGIVRFVALPSKQSLKDELVRHLEAELLALERAHHAVVEGITHEDARPENDKDTRALEQSYLARGQAARVEELRRGVAETRAMAVTEASAEPPAALGAIVIAEEDERRLTFFLAPHGGGTTLTNGTVQVVTPRSALGRAVLGKRQGDACELEIAGRVRELMICKVV